MIIQQARRSDPTFTTLTRPCYNTRRRHSTCGQLSPIAYETQYTPTTLQEAA
jgi:transposase InsO family protein